MKISVVILTYNRKETLKKCLKEFYKQTYKNKEFIIVDNGSDDGASEMIKKDFPKVELIRLPQNFGIPAMNIGIDRARGDIIWRTDDDSHPEDPNAFQRVVEIFKKNRDIGIIATENVEVTSGYRVLDWYQAYADKNNIPDEGFVSNTFHGTGAAIRKEIFDKVGGFWDFGFEETDFAARAIIAGYKVRYFPNIRTLHYAAQGKKNAADRWIQISNQLVRFHVKYLPPAKSASHFLQIYPFQLITGIMRGLPPAAIFEGSLSMIAAAVKTFRTERVKIPKSLISEITMGKQPIQTLSKYFRQAARNKIRKVFKK